MQQTHFTDGHKCMDHRETDFYRGAFGREANALNGPPKGSEHRNPVLGGITPRKFRTTKGMLRANGDIEKRDAEDAITATFADQTAISPTKRVNYQPIVSLSAQRKRLDAEQAALEQEIARDHEKINGLQQTQLSHVNEIEAQSLEASGAMPR